MTADRLLERYFGLFRARDAAGIAALFAPRGLYEFPFLRPRLVGAAEIRAGHAQAFEVAEPRAVELRAVRAAAAVAIAEGRLRARVERDGCDIDLPFAAVAEAENADSGDGLLARLSIYCDAHPYRLWCDGPVMAFGA